MRFLDLEIETRRETPSRAKSSGFAFLVRAGYLTGDSQLTALGHRAILRLQEAAAADSNLFHALGLQVSKTPAKLVLAEIPDGSLNALWCPACQYAAPRDLARSRKPTPAAETPLPIQKVWTPNCTTIESLAAYLGIGPQRTAKAMMFTSGTDDRFMLVVVRGDYQLSEAKLTANVGNTKPASLEQITAAGAVAGYASPIGLGDAIIVVDDLVPPSPNLVAGANESGYHFENTNFPRDYGASLVADLTLASPGDACLDCATPLKPTSATVLADELGYHFESILLALAEQYHDTNGLRLPRAAAPFDVYLMQVPSSQIDTRGLCEQLHQRLEAADVRVLFDDRQERAGVKFHDADLIGCPLRLTVGERNLKNGMVELKRRDRGEASLVGLDEAVAAVSCQLDNMP
jgi:prolyl-tRNA synthetase